MGERSFAKARKKHGERAHSSIKKDGPQEDKWPSLIRCSPRWIRFVTTSGRFRNCGAITPNTLDSAASTGSQHSSQLEPVQRLPHAPIPFGHQDSSFSKFEGSPLRARRSALLSPHGRNVFSLDIYSARNLDCRNRSMRFQLWDYDNGRSLEKPNFLISSKIEVSINAH